MDVGPNSVSNSWDDTAVLDSLLSGDGQNDANDDVLGNVGVVLLKGVEDVKESTDVLEALAGGEEEFSDEEEVGFTIISWEFSEGQSGESVVVAALEGGLEVSNKGEDVFFGVVSVDALGHDLGNNSFDLGNKVLS